MLLIRFSIRIPIYFFILFINMLIFFLLYLISSYLTYGCNILWKLVPQVNGRLGLFHSNVACIIMNNNNNNNNNKV